MISLYGITLAFFSHSGGGAGAEDLQGDDPGKGASWKYSDRLTFLILKWIWIGRSNGPRACGGGWSQRSDGLLPESTGWRRRGGRWTASSNNSPRLGTKLATNLAVVSRRRCDFLTSAKSVRLNRTPADCGEQSAGGRAINPRSRQSASIVGPTWRVVRAKNQKYSNDGFRSRACGGMPDRLKCQFIGACFMALHESAGKFRILASVQRRANSGKSMIFLSRGGQSGDPLAACLIGTIVAPRGTRCGGTRCDGAWRAGRLA